MSQQTAMEKQPPREKILGEGERSLFMREKTVPMCFKPGCEREADFCIHYLHNNPDRKPRSVGAGKGKQDITPDLYDFRRFTCQRHRQEEQDTPLPEKDLIVNTAFRRKTMPQYFLADVDTEIPGHLAEEFFVMYDELMAPQADSDDPKSAQNLDEPPGKEGEHGDDGE